MLAFWKNRAGTLGKKLKSQAGESIGETLVAVLIAALALTMLAGAMSSSLSVIKATRAKMQEYYTSANDLAQMGAKSGNPTEFPHKVTLIMTNKESVIPPFSVSTDGTQKKIRCYCNDEFENKIAVAYDYIEPVNP